MDAADWKRTPESASLMPSRPRRLLFVINEDWYFRSHYRAWALRAHRAGYEVHAAMCMGEHREELRRDPISLHSLQRMQRGQMNPLKKLQLIGELVRLYREVEPDIVHHFTLNIVFCGSIAARLAGVPRIVNAVTGLGHLFITRDYKTKVLRGLVLWVLKHLVPRDRSRFVISNPDDREELLERKVIEDGQVVMIPGSGIDPEHYSLLPEPEGTPVVVLASRMLWPKGIKTFVAAARLLREGGGECRMALVGDTDPGSRSAVPRETLERWDDQGIVEWWGYSEDIVETFREASIICLPSFREGLPRVLIEGSSCGRALIASDVPGCREICRHGVNGLLVPPRDPERLADAIRCLVEDDRLRQQFARRGRKMVVEEFSLESVTNLALEAYSELLGQNTRVAESR